jgi:hypothetical protein
MHKHTGTPAYVTYENSCYFRAYQILLAMPEDEDDPMAAYYSGSLYVLGQADAEVQAHPKPFLRAHHDSVNVTS